MIGDEFGRLQHIVDALVYAVPEHYCEDDTCSLEDPKCRDRMLQRAARDAAQLLEPPHEGFHPKRLTHEHGDAERIYATEWKRENERSPGINGGYTAIEHILHPESEMERDASRGFGQLHPARVTFRDAAVAASVIQWLGTNCGRAFVETCERKIAEARAIRASWPWPGYRAPEAPKGPYQVQAELLAGQLFGDEPRFRTVAAAIEAALDAAHKAGAAARVASSGR